MNENSAESLLHEFISRERLLCLNGLCYPATKNSENVLTYYVLTEEILNRDYRGCGHGWIEIDSSGVISKMRYSSESDHMYLNENGELDEGLYLVGEPKDIVGDDGVDEQNVWCIPQIGDLRRTRARLITYVNDREIQAYLRKTDNNDLRVATNFSCCQAIPIIQT